MAHELEMKFHCKDLNAVRKRALAMGFRSAGSTHQKDTYVVVAGLDAHGKKVYVRVREQNGKASLEYHRKFSAIATQETEVEIADAKNVKKILEWLGYPVVCIVEKRRETLHRKGVNLAFDRIAGLGTFVEIELFGRGSAAVERKILALAKELCLGERAQGGYPTLLMKKHTLAKK